MQDKTSTSGKGTQVGSVITDLSIPTPEMPLFNSREVLWRNISALMYKKYGKEHLSQLAKDAKVGLATVDRIKKLGTSVGSDVVDSLATALGAQPWQLLHPEFDPYATGEAVSFSPLAMDLASQLDEITHQVKRERAYAIATQVIGLADSETEQLPLTSQQPKALPSSGR